MKKYLAGLLTATLLLTMTVGILPTSDGEISALLKQGLTINLNGNQLNMKNATGEVVYPINYNGTTYLPIRSIAETFDLSVDWDADTQTITLNNATVSDQEEPAAPTAPVKTEETTGSLPTVLLPQGEYAENAPSTDVISTLYNHMNEDETMLKVEFSTMTDGVFTKYII